MSAPQGRPRRSSPSSWRTGSRWLLFGHPQSLHPDQDSGRILFVLQEHGRYVLFVGDQCWDTQASSVHQL